MVHAVPVSIEAFKTSSKTSRSGNLGRKAPPWQVLSAGLQIGSRSIAVPQPPSSRTFPLTSTAPVPLVFYLPDRSSCRSCGLLVSGGHFYATMLALTPNTGFRPSLGSAREDSTCYCSCSPRVACQAGAKGPGSGNGRKAAASSGVTTRASTLERAADALGMRHNGVAQTPLVPQPQVLFVAPVAGTLVNNSSAFVEEHRIRGSEAAPDQKATIVTIANILQVCSQQTSAPLAFSVWPFATAALQLSRTTSTL